MKKSLLLLSLAATAIVASGAEQKEPKFYSNSAIQNISPNGKWAVSNVYGTVVLINTETGEETVFEAGEIDVPFYIIGMGNALSNDGVMLCSTETSSNATYYDGEWKDLKVGEAANANSSANGITPDGSRICGNLGLMEMTLDDVTMIVPAVWDRQADGSYGDYTILPHPEVDFTNRAPQYITAIVISDDGRTIVGQVVDCRGAFHYPIVYTQNADGEWSYTLPTESLMNPNNVVIPEYPGESPVRPQAEEFLDEESKAAYDEALDAWVASGYDPTLYPDPLNYMTDEQRQAYDAADAEYETEFAAWSVKYDAFEEAYWAYVEASPNFQFNQIALSPDGKAFAMTHTVEDESGMGGWMPSASIDHVWVINLENNEITKYEDKLLGVKSWAGGYVLAVETDTETGCFNGYMLKDGQVTSLYDYLCGKGEDIKEWVDLNMTHETEVWDWETETIVIKSVSYTGVPVASADLGLIASWTSSVWGDYSPESYLFDFRDSSGIASIKADRKSAIAFDVNGDLTVGEGVAELAVYDLGGVCLMRVANPAAKLSCDIARGVYVVKATYADGTTAAIKAVK